MGYRCWSGFHLLDSVRGVGTPPWVGKPGEAHLAPRICPSQKPIGRARLDPSESVRHGRPFGEQGSTLCGQSRVLGRGPPVFSAGNTGKSLTTQSRIRHRGPPAQGSTVSAPKVLARIDLLSRDWLHPPPFPVCGLGCHLGWDGRAKRASVGKGFTGCGQSVNHSGLLAIPSWALRGEKPRSSRSRPGRTGITPPSFLGRGNARKARQRIQYPAPANADPIV